MSRYVCFPHYLLAALSLTLCVSAAQAQMAELPAYGSVTALDLTLLLPAPPILDSSQQKNDIEAILKVQQAATPARLEQAMDDAKGTVFDMFGKVLGPRFNAKDLTATARLFERLGRSEATVVELAQSAFKRPRPFVVDTRVQVLSKASMMSSDMAKAAGERLPQSGSWPSGRATRVSASAIVLASLFPEHKAALWGRAQDYAQSRVIAGMHYPSDLEMGYRAGTALAATVFRDPEFQTDYQAAKEEIRAVFKL